jgi:hypothetical protein
MKTTILFVFAILTAIVVNAHASTISVESLDRVHVLMQKSAVVELIGEPDGHDTLDAGLKMEVYRLDAPPLMGAGVIYDEKQCLTGQAYIFTGRGAEKAAEQLGRIGFTLMDSKQGLFRLEGKDDDSGLPVVVTISETGDLTTLMVFEKAFYEAHPPRK